MGFKDRIKELRNKNNISAIDLAKQLGKSESAIRMWESGKTKPDADTLIVLSKMFCCTTDYLLGISEYKDMGHYNDVSETAKNLINELNMINPENRYLLILFLQKIINNLNELESIQSIEVMNLFMFFLDDFSKMISHTLKSLLDAHKGYDILIYSYIECQERLADIKKSLLEWRSLVSQLWALSPELKHNYMNNTRDGE